MTVSDMKKGIVVIVKDFGRTHQRSFHVEEIWGNVDLSKYKEREWVIADTEEEINEIEHKAKNLDWDVEHITLYG